MKYHAMSYANFLANPHVFTFTFKIAYKTRKIDYQFIKFYSDEIVSAVFQSI